MERHFYFDGQILSGSDPVTLPISSALLYGKGVFTTVAIHNGQPLLWEKHWSRLERSADRLGLDLSEHSEKSTMKELFGLISSDQVIRGRARLTFFDLRSSVLWPVETELKTAFAITTGEAKPESEHFSLTFSPHLINSLSPLAGIKSCNYLEHVMVLEEAKKRGSDEAIRLNERGVVTSGCMANIFWLKDGELFTASLQTGCLPGTTREYVLENVDCKEVEVEIEEVQAADSIFLTSAGLGIVEVDEFDGKRLERSEHPIKGLWPPA